MTSQANQQTVPFAWSRIWGRGRGEWDVARDVYGLRCAMVNAYMVGGAESRRGGTGGWVLIDAGMPGCARSILAAAERRFGPGARPEAILLTHAHFDHVGSLRTLAEHWDVPVYAHELEIPYLTGRASYAPPDPWAGGMMSLTSPLYPRGPIDLGDRVQPLPPAGSVPHLVEWRVVETPGHSPGHVSFFRDVDRCLIAGDAVCTTKQESLLAVIAQAQAISGPPKYFTHDWQAAHESVRALAQLEPHVAATGHGTPMRGERLRQQLHDLARRFEELAVPSEGRYAENPVVADERGPVRVPPAGPVPTRVYVTVGAAALGVIAALIAAERARSSHSARRDDDDENNGRRRPLFAGRRGLFG